MAIPRMISVDDHVVEPGSLWQERLPAKYREVGPRLERRMMSNPRRATEAGPAPEQPVDVWVYEDLQVPLTSGFAHSGQAEDDDGFEFVTYDQIHQGSYDREARVEALENNHTEASFTFPTFPRFCGQTFLEAKDKDLAKLCVEAYNDWMIDEWCAGPAYGRLIPMTLIPLWDVELAAAEVRRTAAKGSHAFCFSEQPAHLGLPSIYSGYWNPLWQACEETETVVNMHIGSSSKMPETSPDAPLETLMTINVENSLHAFVDWLMSGILPKYNIKIALSEGQVGWIPFFLNRMDSLWEQNIWNRMRDWLPNPPSSYVPGRVYGCIFDDPVGLRNRDLIGMGQIMIETDFPHADSTYPNSRKITEELVAGAGLSEHETWQLVRGNAIDCYQLGRWGITK